MVIAPPLQKRQAEWLESIAEGVRRLEERLGCVVDDLKENDAFVDAVLQASQAAVRTGNEEKREALRNAVLNAALPNAPDESKQQIFINLVDQFTVWHLRSLDLFADPVRWFQKHKDRRMKRRMIGSLSHVLIDAYPELENQKACMISLGRNFTGGNCLAWKGCMSA